MDTAIITKAPKCVFTKKQQRDKFLLAVVFVFMLLLYHFLYLVSIKKEFLKI